MANIKLAIIPVAFLLVATLVHASSEESSGEAAGLGGLLNKLPSTLKNLGDALPLKKITSALGKSGASGGLVVGLLQLLITVLSLPVALVGIVLTLVVSILGAVVAAVIALLGAL